MITKAKIKDIQSLRHKKYREETGLFVAEGPKVVGELLQANIFEVQEIFALSEWAEQQKHLYGNDVQLKIQQINTTELEKISSLTTPHDVVAVFAQKQEQPLRHTETGITLILDDIKDPGNLGTLIRTAHWFGVDQIVCSEGTADQYNSKVVQSTMASLGKLPLYYVSDLESWLLEGREKPLLAAALGGISVMECGSMDHVELIIGNESTGIRASLLQMADKQITIPRVGDAESLNAAVAGAIILYQLRNK